MRLDITGRARPDLAWQESGACATTGPADMVWYPGRGKSARYARQICLTCEVRTVCLEYALANNDAFGVWGGTTEKERRRILRDRETTTEAREDAA